MGATRQERMALGVLALILSAGVAARAVRTEGTPAQWASPDSAAEAPGAGKSLLARSEAVAASDAAAAVPLRADEKVDPNTAGETELRRLPRVSRALAGRIVAWRTAHGGFRTLADLDSVEGVGEGTLDRLAPHLSLPPAPAAMVESTAPTADVTRSASPVVPREAGSGGMAATGSAAGPVDLNRADAAALDGLPGIGPALASRILEWRSRNGPFRSVDDLEKVPGIGPAKLERLRGAVRVSP